MMSEDERTEELLGELGELVRQHPIPSWSVGILSSVIAAIRLGFSGRDELRLELGAHRPNLRVVR